jgi:transposase-like protein
METTDKFDYEAFEKEAMKQLLAGKPLSGSEGVLTPLVKRLMEASLRGELTAHLAEEGGKGNRRNGHGRKRVKTGHGAVDIATPRDRNGSFEPLLLPKRERVLNAELDMKIIKLYGLGMSVRDISEHVRDLYGIEVSAYTISAVTDQVLADVQAWRSRPLEARYAIVWLDAIHFKVKEDGRVVSKAVYTALGVNADGHKDLLGLYVGQSEGAKFWISVLHDLRQRGVEDMLITCIDNLTGFAEAIELVYPQSDIQLCIVHQVRNTLKFVSYKHYKEVVKDMRAIYRAPNEPSALHALGVFSDKWGERYPQAVASWQRNWPLLSSQYRYSERIRRLIYTTNPIEGFHAQLRKYTKTKRVFENDAALLKLLFLAQQRIVPKMAEKTMFAWKEISAELRMIFGQRFNPTAINANEQVVGLPQTPSLKTKQQQQQHH